MKMRSARASAAAVAGPCQLRRRALALDGDLAIVIETDEDGETEEMSAPLWQDVSDALLYAAMAQGAPQYVDAGTRRRSCAPGGPATGRVGVWCALAATRGMFSAPDPHPA